MDDESEAPDDVFWWRFEYALSLGCSAENALLAAANPRLDLHAVEAMRAHGCPLPLALEIAA